MPSRAKPGAGVPVTAARANWDTGYFEAEVVGALLGELGYQVSSAAREMSPDVFYPAVASGVVDVWANGWFPLHNAKLETVLPARGVVGDLASPVGDMVADGALLGYLIDKPTADRYGITTMGDLTRPEIAAIFDRDANGKADLIGCQERWECAAYINRADRGPWLVVEQVQGDYPSLFDDVANRVRRVSRCCTHLDAQLHDRRAGPRPGRHLAAGTEPAGTKTAVAGLAGCTGDPCETGFVPSSIRIVANDTFLEENPAARRLFELVKIDPQDIAQQNLLMRGREHPGRHRAAREAVDPDQPGGGRCWLGEARSAAWAATERQERRQR